MLHISLMNGEARALLCESTQMVQKAADVHNATPVCAAALGRLMTGPAMLGVMMKGAQESVTVTIKGDGPMGTLVAVAHGGTVKAYADNPQVELPLREDGKLDVGGAVGHHGRTSVVKDLGLRVPYIGQISLVSGELAMDFANDFTVSETAASRWCRWAVPTSGRRGAEGGRSADSASAWVQRGNPQPAGAAHPHVCGHQPGIDLRQPRRADGGLVPGHGAEDSGTYAHRVGLLMQPGNAWKRR